jgi:heme exporter protein D
VYVLYIMCFLAVMTPPGRISIGLGLLSSAVAAICLRRQLRPGRTLFLLLPAAILVPCLAYTAFLYFRYLGLADAEYRNYVWFYLEITLAWVAVLAVLSTVTVARLVRHIRQLRPPRSLLLTFEYALLGYFLLACIFFPLAELFGVRLW